jgi:hypothetical protein
MWPHKLSSRLLMANQAVLAAGALSFAVTFRLLAPEIFGRRVGAGGPPADRGQGIGPGGSGLIETFNDSVDIALLVSLGVGVIVAAIIPGLSHSGSLAPSTRSAPQGGRSPTGTTAIVRMGEASRNSTLLPTMSTSWLTSSLTLNSAGPNFCQTSPTRCAHRLPRSTVSSRVRSTGCSRPRRCTKR